MLGFIKLIILATLIFSVDVLAHVSMTNSAPSDQEILSTSPEQISVAFSDEVRLLKVKIKNSEGNNVKFNFKPTKQLASSYRWFLPSLEAGEYSVSLIILGKDGHKMKEHFSFSIR